MKTIDIYAPLPDHSKLNIQQARDICEQLNRELIPYLYSRLKDIYAMKEVDTKAFVRIYELESRICEIKLYQRSLAAKFGMNHFFVPAQEKKLDITDIDSDGDSYISCIGSLFHCPLSSDHIHGPIIAYHVAVAAETLLKSDERLVEIERITWRKVCRTEVRILVVDAGRRSLEQAERCIVQGVIVTSGKRRFEFQALEIPENPVVAEVADSEPTANVFATGKFRIDREKDVYEMDLDTSFITDFITKERKTGSFMLYSLLDLLSRFVSSVSPTDETGPLLFCTLAEFPIPKKLSKKVSLDIRIRRKDAVRSRSGFLLIPADVRLHPHQSSYGEGWFAEAWDQKKATKHLRT